MLIAASRQSHTFLQIKVYLEMWIISTRGSENLSPLFEVFLKAFKLETKSINQHLMVMNVGFLICILWLMNSSLCQHLLSCEQMCLTHESSLQLRSSSWTVILMMKQVSSRRRASFFPICSPWYDFGGCSENLYHCFKRSKIISAATCFVVK